MEIVQGTPLPRSPSFLFIFFPICVYVIFSLPAPPLFLSFFFPLFWVFIAVLWLSLVAASRDYSSTQGFSLGCLLWLRSLDSGVRRLRSCGSWTELPCNMWDLSSQTRDWTCVPCISRQILNHWTTLLSFLRLWEWVGNTVIVYS